MTARRLNNLIDFVRFTIGVAVGIVLIAPRSLVVGLVWTLCAAAGACYTGFKVFRSRREILLEEQNQQRAVEQLIAERLKEVDDAWQQGLLTDAEYKSQRGRIISG